jgi:hypothetical protein
MGLPDEIDRHLRRGAEVEVAGVVDRAQALVAVRPGLVDVLDVVGWGSTMRCTIQVTVTGEPDTIATRRVLTSEPSSKRRPDGSRMRQRAPSKR